MTAVLSPNVTLSLSGVILMGEITFLVLHFCAAFVRFVLRAVRRILYPRCLEICTGCPAESLSPGYRLRLRSAWPTLASSCLYRILFASRLYVLCSSVHVAFSRRLFHLLWVVHTWVREDIKAHHFLV